MENIPDDQIVIQPRRAKKEKTVPENGLLLVNPTEARPLIDKAVAAGAERRFLFNSMLSVCQEPACFLAGPAIGAPMAVISLEKLIALGARKIVLCGWCGGISSSCRVGDIIVPDRALIGEGTSAYYTDSVSSVPCPELSEALVALLTGKGFTVSRGTIWSTDAIYREDRRILDKLHQQQEVVAVDMEHSALCTVAAFRRVQFSAVLIVSDEIWGKSWRPGFKQSHFHQIKESVLTTMIENIGRI
jgi:uridine phosphorylase